MTASLIWAGFPEHMMIAEFLAMIGGEDDDRIVIELLLDQSHDEPSDLMIQVRDTCVISDLCLTRQLRIDRTCLGVKDPSVPLQVFVSLPAADKWRSKLFVLV